jgi:spore coat polysaccharide biosynthesis protein SpsF (cytidylyltransferase family)
MSQLILPKKKEERPTVGIVVQARMTSKRFPGKSMAMLGGKPVIERVWQLCRQIRPYDKLIIAVPDDPASEPIVQHLQNLGGPLNTRQFEDHFAGSEDNVLERYYHAARFFKLDVIVRITGDCPFINPRVSSEVLQLLIWRKLDYVCNVFPHRTFPKGLDTEAFTFDCLEAAYVSTSEPHDLEHVTPWMQRTKGLKRACVQQEIDASDQNWCVDEPSDIPRLEKLIAEAGNELAGKVVDGQIGG